MNATNIKTTSTFSALAEGALFACVAAVMALAMGSMLFPSAAVHRSQVQTEASGARVAIKN